MLINKVGETSRIIDLKNYLFPRVFILVFIGDSKKIWESLYLLDTFGFVLFSKGRFARIKGEYYMDLITQFLVTIVGGLLSGGILITWIEFQRHQREKKEWQLKDRKLELRIINVASVEDKWIASIIRDEKEKLNIYDAGLDGKIHSWMFMVKIAFSNLTDSDILATSLSLEIQQPSFEQAASKKFDSENYFYQRLIRYDLMNKNIISESDLPLIIPAKTTSGVVYMGEWNFGYRSIVGNLPTTATFKILLDDGTLRNINIDFSKSVKNIEILYSSTGNKHWLPAIEKHGQEINKMDEENVPF